MDLATARQNADQLRTLAAQRLASRRIFERFGIDPESRPRPIVERFTMSAEDRAARSSAVLGTPEAERDCAQLEANVLDPLWREASSTPELIDAWRSLTSSESARQMWHGHPLSEAPTAALNSAISERVGADWSTVEHAAKWFVESDWGDIASHLDAAVADPDQDVVLDGILRHPDREWTLNLQDLEDPGRAGDALAEEQRLIESLATRDTPSGVAYDGPALHLEPSERLTITSRDEFWIGHSLLSVSSRADLGDMFYYDDYDRVHDDYELCLFNGRPAHEGPATPDELRDWITGLEGLDLGPDNVTVSISDDYTYQVHLVGTELQVREWNRAFTSPSNTVRDRTDNPGNTRTITHKDEAPAPFNAAETAGPQQTPAPTPQRADAALRLAQQAFPTSLSQSLRTQASVHAAPTMTASQTTSMHLDVQAGHER